MFRRHILGFLGLSAATGGLCFDTPDGGSGGGPAGGAAVVEGAAGDPGGAADPADGDHGADAGAADDPARPADSGDLDDDDADDDVINTLPEQQLRTRHRRTQRWLKKVRPLVERLRGPNRQFMGLDELDRALDDSRQYRQIDSVLTRSPEAVQLLMREQQRLDALDRGERPAAEAELEDQPFNEQEWEFETDTAQGKRFLAMAKQQHEDNRTLRRLLREVQGVQTGFRTQARTTNEQQWKTATFNAAQEIDDPTARRWFISGMFNRFDSLERTNKLQTVNLGRLIDDELKDIRAAKRGKTRQTTTRQSETVARNAALPRTPAPGRTTPAGSDGKPKRETMQDASKGFLSKYAGGTRRVANA